MQRNLDSVAKTIIWAFVILMGLSLCCFAITAFAPPQGSVCLMIPDGDPNVMVVRDRGGEIIFRISQTGEVWSRGYMWGEDGELSYIIGKDNQRRYDNAQDIGGSVKTQENLYNRRAKDMHNRYRVEKSKG